MFAYEFEPTPILTRTPYLEFRFVNHAVNGAKKLEEVAGEPKQLFRFTRTENF